MEFQRNVSLAPFTSLKIGGPAEYFAEVRSEGALAEVLQEAARLVLPVTVLAGGANTLVSDSGVRGLVVLMRIRAITKLDDVRFRVGAGTSMGELVGKTVADGLIGLSWAGGLPGTVGGAVFGNAGTFGHAIGEIVESVEVWDLEAAGRTFMHDACAFGYRSSIFKSSMPDVVVVAVTLKFSPGDAAQLRKEMLEAIAFRNAHHPAPSSAGSFFKNSETPPKLSLTLRTALESGAVKQWFGRVPSGWLIDHAGLRGLRKGGAMLSEKHANFIVNAGNATAADVRVLVREVQQRVQDKFGVLLEEEVRYVGFSE